jgi:hypothetical protein
LRLALNTQLVFNRGIAGRTAQVKRYALAGLLGAKGFSISIEVIKPQEPGCITDRPLLMINYAEKRREGPSAQDELVNPRQVLPTRPLFIHHICDVETCPKFFFSIYITDETQNGNNLCQEWSDPVVNNTRQGHLPSSSLGESSYSQPHYTRIHRPLPTGINDLHA